MKGGYEVQYEKIVKGVVPPVYTTPDEQGRQIKRCSIDVYKRQDSFRGNRLESV